MRVLVHPSAERLAAAAADFVATAARAVPRFSLGLAGGSTPQRTYELLRNRDAPWERVDAWVADERWVPFDHTECNARAASGALFAHVPARLHVVDWKAERTPGEAAADYEQVIRDVVRTDGGRHRPDLVLLGVGSDGHTASLFPDTEALAEDRRLYVSNWVPSIGTWRLTATYPLLHAAWTIVFLVAGSEKAEVVRRILDNDADLPARRVMDGDADVYWMLDEAAAADLRETKLEH